MLALNKIHCMDALQGLGKLPEDYCRAVSSCTHAIHLALRALHIGPGDEVLVPNLTYCGTVSPVVKGAEAPSLLLGSEASEQKLDELATSGRLKDFRYLHFATHGVMDDHAAMRSALILSQDNLPDAFARVLANEEVYDGRLTAEQIVRTWKLDADLVTLSACETALGKRAGGEGFLGFAQALFVAGARSLVLSLWKVDDTATALLMHRFYENLLGRFPESRELPEQAYAPGEAMPKAEALREAKLWLRNLAQADAKIACRAINLDESKVPRGGPALAGRNDHVPIG